jgi:hypothetical protein
MGETTSPGGVVVGEMEAFSPEHRKAPRAQREHLRTGDDNYKQFKPSTGTNCCSPCLSPVPHVTQGVDLSL